MQLIRSVGPERGAAYALRQAECCADDAMAQVYIEAAELCAAAVFPPVSVSADLVDMFH